MGSPLGSTFTNIFLCHCEREWLDNCPICFKLWYTNGTLKIFFFFYLKNTCHFFVDYTSKQHKCLKFTSEAENHNTFSFLNIKITRHSQQFRTPVYIKPTFSGIFTHCESYLDQTYWTSLVNTLLFRWFLIWSDYTLFHLKVENLRKNLKKE